MKELYEQFKNVLIKHPHYEGVVCGYNEEHFLLAVETGSCDFFYLIPSDTFVSPEYTHNKYRYVYEDESEILKQTGTISKSLKINCNG